MKQSLPCSALCLFAAAFACFAADNPPAEWIDPDTGHRVIRLSREPGSESLYFHQNAFTAEGDKMVMETPGGISTVNLKTRAVELIVPESIPGTNSLRGLVVGAKSRTVFYARRTGTNLIACATHLDTRKTRELGVLPGRPGSFFAVNADESLVAGSFVDVPGPDEVEDPPELLASRRREGESKGIWMIRRFEAKLPMKLFTINTATGKLNTFHASTDWLNHVQMSPTDPTQVLFCHEGPWHLLERTWLIRAGGRDLRQVHPRTMAMEIGGHEFFSADGKTVWYDLQTPRGEDFWLAGYEIETGARTWYHLQRDEWSVHFNVSPDGTLFAGDGGDSGQVARAENGKWIYLFRPEPIRKPTGPEPRDDKLIRPGVLRSEKLVNMAKHDYSLEPNVMFTPDGKWIVFRSNASGAAHVLAVEVAKAR